MSMCTSFPTLKISARDMRRRVRDTLARVLWLLGEDAAGANFLTFARHPWPVLCARLTEEKDSPATSSLVASRRAHFSFREQTFLSIFVVSDSKDE